MGFDHIKEEDALVMRPLEKEVIEKMDLRRE
jgi:ssRNA-specific RNase YbeY (16S rRNA maturation enzyme)